MTLSEYMLTCLIEECSEIIKDATKAQRFGLDDIAPGSEQTNAEKIAHEVNDLIGIITMLKGNKLLSSAILFNQDEVEAKIIKVKKWMKYSIEKGFLE